ncbi:MAG: PD-(D/E)XK nuclease family protein [Propionibacteriaceae bacterium]|jgi:superfamily I DNA/RNA helicase/RecB family exonuclease|nr:PD-(D/E)XK nuclease family protein [Propionibacteriaceae bacterium]
MAVLRQALRLVRGEVEALPVLHAAVREVVARILRATGPVLVTGEPGSGKTTALVATVAALVESGVALSQMVLLTSSRQLAWRLRRAVLARLGGAQLQPHITTGYGWSQLLLAEAAGGGVAPASGEAWGAPGAPLTVMSAPEQQWRIAELLRSYPASEWPERFQQASLAPGFAAEVRETLTAARRAGLTPGGLAAFADMGRGAEWATLGRFFAEYLDVTAAEGVVDYTEALYLAAALLRSREGAARLARQVRYVLVDEAAELDAAAIALLQAAHLAGAQVVAFADPTTQVNRFRGASEHFEADFVAAVGDTVARPLLRLELPQRLRVPTTVTVRQAPNAEVRELRLAGWLRTARAAGLSWDDMAVIVPGGAVAVAALARTLTTAGVPVRAAAPGGALADEPMVRWLVEQFSALVETDAPELRADSSVPALLWQVWKGSGWEERLNAEVLNGGVGATRANADLDAAIALFDLAGRDIELSGAEGIQTFIESVRRQIVEADTRRESGQREAVEVLDPIAAVGREWKAVAVLGAVEGEWPVRRGRWRLFDLDAAREGVVDAAARRAAALGEQRRAFALAVSRASTSLYVDCTPTEDNEPGAPSRFLAEFGLPAPQPEPLDDTTAQTLPELVAKLRAVALDSSQSEPLREHAVALLHRLAHEVGVGGTPLLPEVDPTRWWGVGGVSHAADPVVVAGEPIRIPAASLGTLLKCPRRWFLEQRAGGAGASGLAAGVGTALHKLFEWDANAGPLHDEQVAQFIQEQWEALPYRSEALRSAGRNLATAAFQRYAYWREHRSGRALIGSEQAFSIPLTLPDATVLLTGKVDRIELDDQGRVVVVDYKTGKTAQVEKHAEQLACYELAVAVGALGSKVPTAVANAELVWPSIEPRPRIASDVGCLVTPDKTYLFAVEAVELPPLERAAPLLELVAQAIVPLRTERFDARPGQHCNGCAFRRGCPALEMGIDSDE